MSAIVKFDPENIKVPAIFGEASDADIDELGGGISSGFAVVSFRGKIWRIRHKGDEAIIRENNDPEAEPVRRLRAVIVRASPMLTKTYYEGAYTPGADNPPDCFSNDGIRPDPSSPDRQCSTCAACPKNQFGSRVTESGGKAKACQDNKRLAIVPALDVSNEMYGGPMLLRVPPASLAALQKCHAQLKAARVPSYAAVIDIGFDPEAEYPMLTFKPIGVIQSEKMAQQIMEMREGPVAEAVVNGVTGAPIDADAPEPAPKAEKPKPAKAPAKAAPLPEPDEEGEEDGEEEAPAPAPKAKKPAAKKAAPAPAPEEDDPLAGLGDDEEEAPAPAPKAKKPAAKKAAPAEDVETVDDSGEVELGDLLAGLD